MANWLRIAHRGASQHAPENTLSAFRKAVELGTDAIELDVHITRDGQIAVIHDNTLDRTTNKSGSVSGYTLEEIQAFDAGSKFSDEFKMERVPSLIEALAVIPQDVTTWVEVKVLEATRLVVQLIEGLERESNVSIISFGEDILRMSRGRNPNIKTGLIFGNPLVADDPVANAIEMWKRANSVGASSISVECGLATPKAVAEVHKRGGLIYCWTANEPNEIRGMIKTGVDGITSNDLVNLNAAFPK